MQVRHKIREGPKKPGHHRSVYFNADTSKKLEALCTKYNTNINNLVNSLVQHQYKEDFNNEK